MRQRKGSFEPKKIKTTTPTKPIRGIIPQGLWNAQEPELLPKWTAVYITVIFLVISCASVLLHQGQYCSVEQVNLETRVHSMESDMESMHTRIKVSEQKKQREYHTILEIENILDTKKENSTN